MSSGISIQLRGSENGLSGTTLKHYDTDSIDVIQPHVQPFKQGSLDSLCGVYVWINTVHYLVGELSQSQAIDLFNQMTTWLSRKDLLSEVVQDGMDDRLMLRLHKWHIARYQHPNVGHYRHNKSLSNPPKLCAPNRQGVIQTRRLDFCVFESSVHLQSHLSDCPLLRDHSGLLLLSFWDRSDDSEHLTLAWHSDDEYLHLLDSSEWEVLRWQDIRVSTERSRETRKKRYTVYPRYMRWLEVSHQL